MIIYIVGKRIHIARMEVLSVIIENVPLFVSTIIKEKKEETVKYVYDTYITKCISINFDSKEFFLTREKSEIGFELNDEMSTDFLRMLIRLIQTRGMNENIKNSSNRIHFRVYKQNALLDSKNNEIRKSIVICLVDQIGPDPVLKFLLDERCALWNMRLTLDPDSDAWCDNEVILYRCDCIIESILKHKVPTSPI